METPLLLCFHPFSPVPLPSPSLPPKALTQLSLFLKGHLSSLPSLPLCPPPSLFSSEIVLCLPHSCYVQMSIFCIPVTATELTHLSIPGGTQVGAGQLDRGPTSPNPINSNPLPFVSVMPQCLLMSKTLFNASFPRRDL
ncbi:hypothetical protein H1C71_003972 [Ictidomys tridecemlineatus]|nr:hypothetical protein H1C71_003972 [Ictidomys tridecemlineatus]